MWIFPTLSLDIHTWSSIMMELCKLYDLDLIYMTRSSIKIIRIILKGQCQSKANDHELKMQRMFLSNTERITDWKTQICHFVNKKL